MKLELLKKLEGMIKVAEDAFDAIGSYQKSGGNKRKQERVVFGVKLKEMFSLIKSEGLFAAVDAHPQGADLFTTYFNIEMARILISIMQSHPCLTSCKQAKVSKNQYALGQVSCQLNKVNTALLPQLKIMLGHQKLWVEPLVTSGQFLLGLLTETSDVRGRVNMVVSAAKQALLGGKKDSVDELITAMSTSQFTGLTSLVQAQKPVSANKQGLRAAAGHEGGGGAAATSGDRHTFAC